jgi:hypothetical protein
MVARKNAFAIGEDGVEVLYDFVRWQAAIRGRCAGSEGIGRQGGRQQPAFLDGLRTQGLKAEHCHCAITGPLLQARVPGPGQHR